MCGIFTDIYHKNQSNLGNRTIHGYTKVGHVNHPLGGGIRIRHLPTRRGWLVAWPLDVVKSQMQAVQVPPKPKTQTKNGGDVRFWECPPTPQKKTRKNTQINNRCYICIFFLVWHKDWWDIFPQIAIAIGVLTSNRGEGDEPLWRIGRGTRVPLQGAVDVVPLLGAIVVYCGWGGGWRPTLGEWTWCHCWVPLHGAIVVCYGGARGGWRPTLGEWTWCHCWVPLQGAIVVCYGGGEGAIAGCSGRVAIAGCHCRRGRWRPTLGVVLL